MASGDGYCEGVCSPKWLLPTELSATRAPSHTVTVSAQTQTNATNVGRVSDSATRLTEVADQITYPDIAYTSRIMQNMAGIRGVNRSVSDPTSATARVRNLVNVPTYTCVWEGEIINESVASSVE